ncbi:MAG: hypothetical protein IPL33_02890 [Sphingobacteriales bacterium]|nr:hypothetical protein [Sphingobacteriales bacterium]
MKKLLLTLIALWISALMLNPNTAQTQCGCAYQFETTFPEAVKAAPVVIEGEVISDVHFFGGVDNYDYITLKIKVFKVLKGDITAQELEIIQPNVKMSDRCGYDSPGLSVFILYPVTRDDGISSLHKITSTPFTEIPMGLKFRPKLLYGVGCNVVNYDSEVIGAETVYNRFGLNKQSDIKKKIYNTIKKETGYSYNEIAKFSKKNFLDTINESVLQKEAQTINITDIIPNVITAGTFDTLTIKGNGFTSDWLVAFREADSYTETYMLIPDNHYIIRPNSTNDSMYKVIVPSVDLDKRVEVTNNIIVAATGKVALKKGNTIKKSSQTLTIPYAESTYARSDTSSIIYPVRLARNTPNGDFTFWLHPSVRGNNPVRNLVQDAVEQWRCASRVNFTLACDSTTSVPLVVDDHISTVSMVDSSMPFSGLLGNRKAGTINRIRVCNSAEQAIVTESDVIFRNFPVEPLPGGGTQTLDWYYNGYTPGAIHSGHYDFYSMALHEFGHAHLLEHVTNTNALMNTFSWHGLTGVIHEFDTATVIAPALHIATLSNDNSTNTCLNAMQFIPPAAACTLPDCAFIDCGDPGYPLQVHFSLMPEACLSNPDFDDVSDAWQQMVGTNVSIWAQDQSIGNIIERTWTFSSDVGTVSHLPATLTRT